MAEYYSANLSREVLKGLKENAYNAIYNGGTMPYGYNRADDNGSNIELDPVASEAVKLMFNMTLNGFKRCDL